MSQNVGGLKVVVTRVVEGSIGVLGLAPPCPVRNEDRDRSIKICLCMAYDTTIDHFGTDLVLDIVKERRILFNNKIN